MKAPSLKLYVAAVLLWTIIMGSGVVLLMTSASYQERGLRNLELRRARARPAAGGRDPAFFSPEDALAMTARTPEVRALKARFRDRAVCISRKALRPCDTDWVTCVEDAWVVVYAIRSACLREPDERMALRFLVDSRSGAIRSRYPEVDYFQDPQYCQVSADCMAGDDPATCVNFVQALTAPANGPVPPAAETPDCRCQEQRCVAMGKGPTFR